MPPPMPPPPRGPWKTGPPIGTGRKIGGWYQVGGGDVQAFKAPHPLPFHPECDGVSQVLLEAIFGRSHVLEAGEVVQIVAERLPFPPLLRSHRRPLGHEGREAPDDDHGDDGAEQEIPPSTDVGVGEDGRQHAQDHRDEEAVAEPAGAHAWPDCGRTALPSPLRCISARRWAARGCRSGCAAPWWSPARGALRRRATGRRCSSNPWRSSRGFVRVKMVSARGVAVLAFDVGHLEVAAPRQIDDRGDHLLGVDLLIDEGADQSRRKVGRGLAHVAGIGLGRVVASAAPPDEEHAQEEEQWAERDRAWAR